MIDSDCSKESKERVCFSITQQKQLVSRADVISTVITRADQAYRACVICNVFTFPVFRGKGYGKCVIQSATHFISQSNADMGLLFCNPYLESFYASAGWESYSSIKVRVGTPERHEVHNGFKMLYLISIRAKNYQANCMNQPLYIKNFW